MSFQWLFFITVTMCVCVCVEVDEIMHIDRKAKIFWVLSRHVKKCLLTNLFAYINKHKHKIYREKSKTFKYIFTTPHSSMNGSKNTFYRP